MWKNFITNHVKMSFKESALIIVGSVCIRLAESVEKKSSQMLARKLNFKSAAFSRVLTERLGSECIILSQTILILW